MDLKEFTTQTLVQIVEGAIEANAQLSRSNSFVPTTDTLGCPKDELEARWEKPLMHNVDFDVAITTIESDGKSGGAGIRVASLALGGNIESKIENQTISRVKYSIPIVIGEQK